MVHVGYETGMVPVGSRVIAVVSQGPAPVAPRAFVETPDVVGKSQGAALESMSKAPLQTQVVYDHHGAVRKGMVVAQWPSGGVSVPVGGQALIIVSSGPGPQTNQMVKLPSVVGLTESEAVGVLSAAGLEPRVMYDQSPSTPAGVVSAQLPDTSTYTSRHPGSSPVTTVLMALAVLALVALGLWFWFAGGRATVPDVVGMSTEQATEALEDAGLVVGVVAQVEPAESGVEPGTVLSSDPAGGVRVAKSSKVNLKVAAAAVAEVPYVVGQQEAVAKAALSAAGFEVEVSYRDGSSAEPGTVISQSPSGGSTASAGRVIKLMVAGGQATDLVGVPSVAGLSATAAKAALAAAGLNAQLAESPSESVAADMVITQSPAAGTMLNRGDAVLVIVSTGPPPAGTTVAVPSVVGLSLEQAISSLTTQGFAVAVYPADASQGTVTNQAPAPNSMAQPGAEIIIVIEE